MNWLKERSLTLVLLFLFLAFTVGQVLAGHRDYNRDQQIHGDVAVTLGQYLETGHPWEALFENWESEFLQMGVFVIFTVFLYQKGSPESRRVGVIEEVDADPRRFTDELNAPWAVKRGAGALLWLYERSLGLAFILLFLLSWLGHMISGWRLAVEQDLSHGRAPETLGEFAASSTFWFESFQNWQSEFLAIAAMVWLSVYLRHRGSPESKPVHVAHDET
jgi:hypothetical protein